MHKCLQISCIDCPRLIEHKRFLTRFYLRQSDSAVVWIGWQISLQLCFLSSLLIKLVRTRCRRVWFRLFQFVLQILLIKFLFTLNRIDMHLLLLLQVFLWLILLQCSFQYCFLRCQYTCLLCHISECTWFAQNELQIWFNFHLLI